jgi:hypothetical protein
LIAIDQDLFYFIVCIGRELNLMKLTYLVEAAATLGFNFYRNNTRQTLNQLFHVPNALVQQLLAILQA